MTGQMTGQMAGTIIINTTAMRNSYTEGPECTAEDEAAYDDGIDGYMEYLEAHLARYGWSMDTEDDSCGTTYYVCPVDEFDRDHGIVAMSDAMDFWAWTWIPKMTIDQRGAMERIMEETLADLQDEADVTSGLVALSSEASEACGHHEVEGRGGSPDQTAERQRIAGLVQRLADMTGRAQEIAACDELCNSWTVDIVEPTSA